MKGFYVSSFYVSFFLFFWVFFWVGSIYSLGRISFFVSVVVFLVCLVGNGSGP